MTIWQQVWTAFGINKSRPKIDPELVRSVHALAEREHRSPEEVIVNLLSLAIKQREEIEQKWYCWQILTPREKQISALICHGLTGKQIAERLYISTETVKTHARHILRKFNLHSRRELQQRLAGWDFGDWLQIE